MTYGGLRTKLGREGKGKGGGFQDHSHSVKPFAYVFTRHPQHENLEERGLWSSFTLSLYSSVFLRPLVTFLKSADQIVSNGEMPFPGHLSTDRKDTTTPEESGRYWEDFSEKFFGSTEEHPCVISSLSVPKTTHKRPRQAGTRGYTRSLSSARARARAML